VGVASCGVHQTEQTMCSRACDWEGREGQCDHDYRVPPIQASAHGEETGDGHPRAEEAGREVVSPSLSSAEVVSLDEGVAVGDVVVVVGVVVRFERVLLAHFSSSIVEWPVRA